MSVLPRLPLSVVRACGALLFGGLFATSAAGQVDLVAQLVNGPGQVHVDQDALVTVQVQNQGDPLTGDYTLEILLSQDLVVGPEDPVVATVQTGLLGVQHVIAHVPFSVPDVQHTWVLRVIPAPGETNVQNNVAFGPVTNVIKTDLELADPDPIQAFVHANDDPLAPIPVRVNNVGTPNSILVFTVTKLTPAPWLTLDPPSSFAIGDQEGNDIQLLFDHSGLEPGDYPVVLRFENFSNPNDSVDLTVTLSVGVAIFHPGHTFLGQISFSGETDEVAFDGIAGERVFLQGKSRSGNLKPVFTFIDPDGIVERAVKFPHSQKYLTKSAKLKKSGQYLIRISGAKGTVGSYKVKTKAKYPKKGKPHTVKLKNPAGGIGAAKVLMLSGGQLEFSLDPNAHFAGPLAIAFTTPSGVQFDVTANSKTTATGELVVEGVPIAETGPYTVSVFGFGGGKKERVKVRFQPFQPPQKKGKVYLK